MSARPTLKARLTQPRTLGLIGLVFAVAVGGAVAFVSGATFGAHTYRAELEQTAGLRVGEAVQIAGVDVGEIRSFDLEGQKVIVEFTVDSDLALGDRTSAEVRVATLLGTHFLQVKPDGNGELAGDLIPVARTTVPFNLQDVIDETADQLGRLDTGQLSDALSSITDVLRASGDEVGPALDGITRLSDVVVRRGAEFEGLLSATKGVTDQLAGSSNDLISLMGYASSFIEELTARRADVHALLVHVQQISTTLEGIIDDNEQHLGPLLADLDIVTTALRGQEKALALAADRLATTSRYLSNATGSGPFADLYLPEGSPDFVACIDVNC